MEFLATCSVFSDPNANRTFIQVLGTIRLVVKILQIAVPIALIVWGSLDLGKAVIAGDEKKIKENQGRFVKRIVAAVLVFLVPFIVNLIMGFVSQGTWKACWDASADQSLEGNDTIQQYNY